MAHLNLVRTLSAPTPLPPDALFPSGGIGGIAPSPQTPPLAEAGEGGVKQGALPQPDALRPGGWRKGLCPNAYKLSHLGTRNGQLSGFLLIHSTVFKCFVIRVIYCIISLLYLHSFLNIFVLFYNLKNRCVFLVIFNDLSFLFLIHSCV